MNTREAVREALRQNLIDTTGECTCYEGYASRNLIDPECAFHVASGVDDDDSVNRIMAVIDADRTKHAVAILRGGARDIRDLHSVDEAAALLENRADVLLQDEAGS